MTRPKQRPPEVPAHNQTIPDRTAFLIVTSAVVVGVGLRLAYAYQSRSDLFVEHPLIDAQFYDKWAMDLLAGRKPPAAPYFQDPFYAYFLAACYKLFGHSFNAVRVVQGLLDCITLLLMCWIGTTLSNPLAGLATAWLAACYSPSIYYTGLLDKTTVTGFLVATSIALGTWSLRRASLAGFFLTGLVFGLTTLLRGNLLLVWAALTAWLIYRLRTTGLSARSVMAFVLGTGVIIGSVAARNYFVGHDTVLLTANGGVNFYYGNNEMTTGNFIDPPWSSAIPETEYEDSRVAAEHFAGHPFSKPSKVSAFWFHKGLDFILKQPGSWLALMGRKSFLMINSFEIPETYSFYYFRGRYPYPGLRLLNYGIILSLGIAGFLIAVKDARLSFVHVFAMAYALSTLAFYITSRYRSPIVVPLLIFSGDAIAYGILEWRQRKQRQLGIVVSAVCCLGALSYYTPHWMQDHVVRPGLSTPHTLAGSMYLEAHRFPEAIHELEASRELSPNDAGIRAWLGDAYRAVGRPNDALGSWLEAIRLNPRFHEVYNNMGTLYFEHKNYEMAAKAFQAAFSLKPDEPAYRENLIKARSLLAKPPR